jgi:hypothetical protein
MKYNFLQNLSLLRGVELSFAHKDQYISKENNSSSMALKSNQSISSMISLGSSEDL